MCELLLAEVRTETHELAVSENTSDLQFAAVLKIQYDLLYNRNPPIDERVLNDLFSKHLDLLYFSLKLSLCATHYLIQLLFIVIIIFHQLFLLYSLNLVLYAVQINEAFQAVVR